MNWIVFAITAYVALALEVALEPLLVLPGPTGVTPSLVLVLAVYIGLMAPGAVVPWALLVLGILADLLPGPIQGATLLGPTALAYLVGAFALLQLRTLVFRESIITMAALTFGAGIFIQLTIIAILTMRGLPFLTAQPVPEWDAATQLVQRFFALLYSAAVALPLGAVLIKSTPLWGFPTRGRSRGD